MRLDGEHISGSPFSVAVQPGSALDGLSTVGLSATCLVNVPNKFKIVGDAELVAHFEVSDVNVLITHSTGSAEHGSVTKIEREAAFQVVYILRKHGLNKVNIAYLTSLTLLI